MSWLVRFFSVAWSRRLPLHSEIHTSSESRRSNAAMSSSWVMAPPIHSYIDETKLIVVDASAERGHVDVAADDRILEVVHRVGDVVGEIRDLRLDAEPPLGARPPHPLEHVDVVGVEAELVATARVADPEASGHGYLQLASRLARVRLSPTGRPSG